MNVEEIFKLALGHQKLRAEDITRLRRAKRRKDRTRAISPRPDVPLNMTIHFSRTDKETARVFDKRIVGMTRRVGPRQTKRQREALMLSEADLVALRELEPLMLKFIASGKENAALFTDDPLRALDKMGAELNPAFIRRLRLAANRLQERIGPIHPPFIANIKVDTNIKKGPQASMESNPITEGGSK